MPLVCPIHASDFKRLEAKFIHGNKIGKSVFYVSLINEKGEENTVIANGKVKQGPLWNEENEQFERFFKDSPSLSSFHSRMFFIFNGNHHFKA